MVDLHAFRTRSIEGFVHKDVAVHVTEMAHARIRTSMRVISRLHGLIEIVFKLVSAGTEKVPIGVRPENFAVNEIGRDLFATVA